MLRMALLRPLRSLARVRWGLGRPLKYENGLWCEIDFRNLCHQGGDKVLTEPPSSKELEDKNVAHRLSGNEPGITFRGRGNHGCNQVLGAIVIYVFHLVIGYVT